MIPENSEFNPDTDILICYLCQEEDAEWMSEVSETICKVSDDRTHKWVVMRNDS